jgi:hypothetical protein
MQELLYNMITFAIYVHKEFLKSQNIWKIQEIKTDISVFSDRTSTG